MESGRVYFLTFSTYGTRLPGRKEGAYRWNSFYYEPNEALRCYMQNNLSQPAVTFDPSERALVHDAFVDVAREKGWEIDALNVRTEHVHIVIFTPTGDSTTEIVRKLKRSATSALQRASRRPIGLRVWTKRFVETTIWNVGFWRQKVRYTLDEQGDNSYLRLSRFGQEKIREIRSEPRRETVTTNFLYGGEDRANIRAAFFSRERNCVDF